MTGFFAEESIAKIYELPAEPWEGFYPRHDGELAASDQGKFFALTQEKAEFWKDLVAQHYRVDARRSALAAELDEDAAAELDELIGRYVGDETELDVQIAQKECALDEFEERRRGKD